MIDIHCTYGCASAAEWTLAAYGIRGSSGPLWGNTMPSDIDASKLKHLVEIPQLARLELENAHLRVMLLDLQLAAAQRERQRKAQETAQQLGIDLASYEIDIGRGVAVRVVPPATHESTAQTPDPTPKRSTP